MRIKKQSNRWARIVGHIGNGLTNKEISEAERISCGTVRSYIMRIYAENNLHGNAYVRKMVSLAARGRLRVPTVRV